MIKKCLFPAAGYGTRFLPATKAVPKEMLPILNKPLLQYGIEEAIEAGILNIALVTGKGKRAIEDHFDCSSELDNLLINSPKKELLNGIKEITEKITLTYIRQRMPLGLGHAILTAEPLIGNDTFAIHLADDLCANDKQNVLSQMIEVYKKFQCNIIAIEEISSELTSQYGIISAKPLKGEKNLYEVEKLVEKPLPEDAPSNLAIIGRYILEPEIFEHLKKISPGANGEIQLTDAISRMLQNSRVIALKFSGKRFDCGNVKGFVEATNHFYSKLYS